MHTSEAAAAEFVAARLDDLPDGADSEREAWIAVLGTALALVAGDDPAAENEFLKVFLFDGRAPIVVFFTEKHEDESDELLERLLPLLAPAMPEVWLFDDPRSVTRKAQAGLRRL